jgi:DNA-binding beta-propeller fold protein YncE
MVDRWRTFSGGALTFSLFAAAIASCGGDPPAQGPGSSAPISSTANVSAVPVPPSGVRVGSTVALTPDGMFAVVANEDHKSLALFPLPILDDDKPIRMETPGRPAQVVALGTKIYVTVRELDDGAGALVAFDRRASTSDLSEVGRVALPPDAWGLTISPDGTSALVSSAWSAKVSRVDLATMKVAWTRDVAREPRGIVFMKDGDTAYVSHLIDAPLTRIDEVTTDATVARVDFPASPLRSAPGERLSASLGYALALNPDETRLYAPRHALGAHGQVAWFGTAAVDVFDVPAGKPIGIPRESAARVTFIAPFSGERATSNPNSMWWDFARPEVQEGDRAFIQPRAAVYRKSQNTLLVASEGTDQLIELDALMSDPTLGVVRQYWLAQDRNALFQSTPKGGAPTGIALSPDESVAYVHCRSTDELAVFPLPDREQEIRSVTPLMVKTTDVENEKELAVGRLLFYDATDDTVSGGLGCAGCHPEGRDDGYVWHEVIFGEKEPFTNFFGSASGARHVGEVWERNVGPIQNAEGFGVGYARQTPMLAGRVKPKGPYGWKAESKDLEARLTEGFGLHRWTQAPEAPMGTLVRLRVGPLAKFIREGLVPPPSLKRPLNQEETRGKEIFSSEKAACSSCHAPDSDYTNRSIATFGANPPRQAFVAEKDTAYKTPSLLFVGGSPPYFHDGRYATLEELIEKNGTLMGNTSDLSEADKKALVAFLRTL